MRTLTYKFHSHEKQAENTSDPESPCGPVFSFLHFWSPWKTIRSRDELVDLKPVLPHSQTKYVISVTGLGTDMVIER